MTGTDLSAIVTPIVAMISLAVWLAMVFYADAHPGVRRQAPAQPAARPRPRAAPSPPRPLRLNPGRPDPARR
jgi:hypothetical protein